MERNTALRRYMVVPTDTKVCAINRSVKLPSKILTIELIDDPEVEAIYNPVCHATD